MNFQPRLNFISGLPRSGSTLLRQNPALHANITSPIASMVGAMLAEMSAGNAPGLQEVRGQVRAVER